MSDQMSLPNSLNVTSSPASVDGAMPCASPVGPTTNPSGPAHARASLSARQAKAMGLLTSGTYGPHGTGSLESASLASSLVSRLKARLTTAGSTLFKLTWKQKVTPSGRLVYRLAASVPRTSGNGCGSWPSPNAGPQNDGDTTWEQRRKALKAKHKNGNGFGMTLGQAVSLASWPTPTAQDHSRGVKLPRPWDAGIPLTQQVALASWATPTVPLQHDSEHSAFRWNPNKKQADPVNQILGRSLSLSDVPTEKRGQLNPAFSRWLMGYPPAWDACAAMVTPLSRKLRRK